jgi:hypothetical protein
MAQQTIGVGSSANDGTGDPLRTAFNKINANFSELYGDTAEANDILDDTSPQLGGNLDINGFNITSARSNENIRIIPNGSGTVELEGTTNVTGNLTATGDIFANGNINLGDASGDQTKVTGVFEADQLQIDGTTLTSTVTNGSVTIQGNATGGVNVADITINDNKISASNSNSNLELSASGTGNVIVGAVTISGTTLSAADSSQITIAEALQVNGAASLGTSLALATGATVTGILDEDAMGTNSATQLATQQSIKAYADLKAVQTGTTNNQVTTVTGANAFQGEANLTFDGSTLAVTGAGTFSTTLGITGTLTTADITTTGTHTVTGQSDIDYVRIKDHAITTNASNANLDISANGTGVVNVASAMTTVGQTVTGTVAITGSADIDNLNFNGNTISATSSNGGLILTPNGSGTVTINGVTVAIPGIVAMGKVTIDNTLWMMAGSKIQANDTNGDVVLESNGTGSIVVDQVSITDNTITTHVSNANLVLDTDGTGVVAVTPQLTLSGSFKQAIHTFTATDAITETEHAGRTCLLGEVGGNALVTLTLPDATGSGATYKFIVSVANTSNYVIVAPDASNTIGGIMLYLDEDGTAVTAFPTVAATDTITLNGGTTGGIIGDYLELVDIATDKWHVRGTMRVSAGANPATPFSATV